MCSYFTVDSVRSHETLSWVVHLSTGRGVSGISKAGGERSAPERWSRGSSYTPFVMIDLGWIRENIGRVGVRRLPNFHPFSHSPTATLILWRAELRSNKNRDWLTPHTTPESLENVKLP